MLYLTDDFGRAVASTTLDQLHHSADALLDAKADVLVIDAADPDLCYYDSAIDHRWAGQPWDVLFDAGHDPYGITVGRLKRAGANVLAGMRMNDHHGSLEMWTPWEQAHTDWALGRDTGDRTWRAVGDLRQMDYAIAEVREHRLAIVEEIVTRYPVDGLQLDLGRSVPFLSEDKREKAHHLTQFVRDTRRVLDRVGRQTGRTLTLGAIMPWDLASCRAEGLEIDVWIREGLITHVAPGEWYYTDWNMPLADWARLIADSDCRLAPMMLGNVAAWREPGKSTITLDGDNALLDGPKIRALAELFYAQGAHDIMLYNYYAPQFGADYPHLRDWTDRDSLATQSRHYFYCRRLAYIPTEAYTFHSTDAFARFPLRVAGDTVSYEFRFSAPARGTTRLLRFKAAHLAAGDRLAVTINGSEVENAELTTHPVHGEDGATYGLWSAQADMSPLESGVNTLHIALTTADPTRTAAIEAGEFELFVTPMNA